MGVVKDNFRNRDAPCLERVLPDLATPMDLVRHSCRLNCRSDMIQILVERVVEKQLLSFPDVLAPSIDGSHET